MAFCMSIKMNDLTRGMHASVRTSSTKKKDRFIGHTSKRVLQSALDGRLIVLSLPAIKTMTIIFNATGQVVHFDTHAKRHIDAWIWGTNSYLPSSIAVCWSR